MKSKIDFELLVDQKPQLVPVKRLLNQQLVFLAKTNSFTSLNKKFVFCLPYYLGMHFDQIAPLTGLVGLS